MDKNVEILFIRHAESYGNVAVPDESAHPDDPRLTSAGLRQAQKLADRYKTEPIAAIYASALVRTCQTVEPLAALTGKEVRVLRELMEVGTEIPNTPPERAALLAPQSCRGVRAVDKTPVLFPPASGDPADCARRAAYAMEKVFADAADGDRIAICTHGGFIGYLLRYCLGLSLPEHFNWQIDNCSVFRIKMFADRMPKLVCANDVSHLI